MKKYREEILGRLIDKYERSKTFIGQNEVSQSFSIDLAKEFKEYADDSKTEEILAIDHALSDLSEKGWINEKRRKNGLTYAAVLVQAALPECYVFLKRKPKQDINSDLTQLLYKYLGSNDITRAFCEKQLERLADNKKAEHFRGDLKEYENLLKGLSCILTVEQETYERDFSVRVYGDSKTFEKTRGAILSVLFEYGDFSDKETLLQDLNIIKNPGYVYFKGDGVLSVSGQVIDVGKLPGGIALPSTALKGFEGLTVSGCRVVSIENLTTFNAYSPDNEFVIYLGGYHNAVRREFIKRLYQWNPEISYYHYGDIDAGGFYILLHLRRRTGVNFIPLHMDTETIKTNIGRTKPLTENDRKRLNNLLGNDFDDVIRFMLQNNCKLEQENLD